MLSTVMQTVKLCVREFVCVCLCVYSRPTHMQSSGLRLAYIQPYLCIIIIQIKKTLRKPLIMFADQESHNELNNVNMFGIQIM